MGLMVSAAPALAAEAQSGAQSIDDLFGGPPPAAKKPTPKASTPAPVAPPPETLAPQAPAPAATAPAQQSRPHG